MTKMEVEIKMPDLGTTEDQVRIIKWLVEVGEAVELGQPLLEIETDKASMPVESFVAGTLKSIEAAPDDEVSVGQVIAIIETGAAGPAPPPPVGAEAPAPEAPATAGSEGEAAARPRPAGTKRGASMFARNRESARRRAGGGKTVPLSAARRIVGRRMQESKQNAPHFYLQASANAEPMIARREAAAPARIVWDAFFVKAVAAGLDAFDRMRYRVSDNGLAVLPTPAVGVAVNFKDDLYVVPIREPRSLDLQQISDAIVSRLKRIRTGDPEARKLEPADLTVTYLGGVGVETFVAIINPPESAVLAVGKIEEAVIATGGKITVQQRVNLCLSVDHRVVNGRYAALFLKRVIEELESV